MYVTWIFSWIFFCLGIWGVRVGVGSMGRLVYFGLVLFVGNGEDAAFIGR